MTDTKLSDASGLRIRYFRRDSESDLFERGIWTTILIHYIPDICRGGVTNDYLKFVLEKKLDLLFILAPSEFDFRYPSILTKRWDSIRKNTAPTSDARFRDWMKELLTGSRKYVKPIHAALKKLAPHNLGFSALRTSVERWELELICTRPQASKTRASYGTTLMQAIFAESERVGIGQIRLHSVYNAIPFYRKLGFQFGSGCGPERVDLKALFDKRGQYRFPRPYDDWVDPRIRKLFEHLARYGLCWGSEGENPNSINGCLQEGAVMTRCLKRLPQDPSSINNDVKDVSVVTPSKYALHHFYVEGNRMGSDPFHLSIDLPDAFLKEFVFLLRGCFPDVDRPEFQGWVYYISFDGPEGFGIDNYPIAIFLVDKKGVLYNACTQFCERGQGHFRRLLGAYLDDRAKNPDLYPKKLALDVDAKDNLNAYATYVKMGFVGDESHRHGRKLSSDYRMILPDRAVESLIRDGLLLPDLSKLEPGPCYDPQKTQEQKGKPTVAPTSTLPVAAPIAMAAPIQTTALIPMAAPIVNPVPMMAAPTALVLPTPPRPVVDILRPFAGLTSAPRQSVSSGTNKPLRVPPTASIRRHRSEMDRLVHIG